MHKSVAFILLFALVTFGQPVMAADQITCWFPPSWESRIEQAETIAQALSSGSGLAVRAKVASSYPEILEAFASPEQSLVYIGSFVQSIIAARKLGHPLVQNVDGHEMYAGILITKKGGDPTVILTNHPERIAYTVGASSGESSAKAATHGLAAIGVNSHAAAVSAVLKGEAAGAFVKDWWWEANRERYSGLERHKIPGVSIQMNPDDVLTASRAVSVEDRARIRAAAIDRAEVFGRKASMQDFRSAQLAFPLGLMQKGKMDPLTYSW